MDRLPLIGRLLLGLALIAGCGSGAATQARPSSTTTAAADCEDVVRPGKPITGAQLLDGCRTDDGRLLTIDHYPCRGTGNVVAVLERDGRAWSGEASLAWEEEPRRGRTYGTWRGGYRYDPSADAGFDAAGCLVGPPDLVEPSPS